MEIWGTWKTLLQFHFPSNVGKSPYEGKQGKRLERFRNMMFFFVTILPVKCVLFGPEKEDSHQVASDANLQYYNEPTIFLAPSEVYPMDTIHPLHHPSVIPYFAVSAHQPIPISI